MLDEEGDFQYFNTLRPDRTYISRAFPQPIPVEPGEPKKVRIVSKVFDSEERHAFANIKRETVLRITPGGRQEVKVTFYDDSRRIDSITIQRFSKADGKPLKQSFTFRGQEIETLYNLLQLIRHVYLGSTKKVRLDDELPDYWRMSEDEEKRYFLDRLDLVAEITKNHITKRDVVALAYRKVQLELFARLLNDPTFFAKKKSEWSANREEDVWERFFEQNPWIFGYGLNFIFTSRLDEKKLEQVTSGYTFQKSGKRADAFMKTRGFISSLCFVEMKTHKTVLLHRESQPYRPESWRVSSELTGSIAQVQKTIQKAVEDLKTKIQIARPTGEPTGETMFLYHPKACVVIGSLDEFATEHGINEQKFSSFELFRRNIVNPEIITFDELYERAKFIVQHSETEAPFLDTNPKNELNGEDT